MEVIKCDCHAYKMNREKLHIENNTLKLTEKAFELKLQ